MDIEKVKVDERDTWAYWENKFKGMTQEEIDEYWNKEMREATNDESMLMDISDGFLGIRAEIVRASREKYMNAKAKHEGNKENVKEDVEREME